VCDAQYKRGLPQYDYLIYVVRSVITSETRRAEARLFNRCVSCGGNFTASFKKLSPVGVTVMSGFVETSHPNTEFSIFLSSELHGLYIVTHRPISRQRPKYAHATIGAMSSMWSVSRQ
jgi:hypothetical protein